MGDILKLSEGEVHALTHRAFISPNASGPVILRGASITLYAVREASQGEDLRLDVSRYLNGKSTDSRAYAHRFRRLLIQRSAPQGNFRRLIGAIADPGVFCFDTIKFVLEGTCQISLDLLAALVNSQILDWYFRLSSTNSKVNEYQFSALPVPKIVDIRLSSDWGAPLTSGRWAEVRDALCSACNEPGVMPKAVAEAVAAMSRRIQEIEAKRVLKNRSERSRLAPESQPIQDAIDAVLFRCYGLSDDDADYVRQRLKVML